MNAISTCGTAVLLIALAAPAFAVTELSGTVTREEDGTAIGDHTVGVSRWSEARGTPAGEAVPVEWTVNTDELGFYRFELDESLLGMDRLLVFTSDHRVFGELYPAVDLSGVDPKGADIREPGVVLLDLTGGSLTNIDFVVARMERIEMVPMDDGTRLDTRIHLPSRRPGMRWPVLLHRTPYQLWGGNSDHLRADYAVVNQNTRGRFDSEGEDMVFDADGWLEHKDGYDTVKWIADQPFCEDRKICAHGKSAPGITSYLLAGTAPEELVCVWTEVATSNLYDLYYAGGEFRKHDVESWAEANDAWHKLDEIYEHPSQDAYWAERTLLNRLSMVDVPILAYSGWYDYFLQGTLDIFTGLQASGAPGARRNQKIIIGPWTHDTAYNGTLAGVLRYPENSTFPEHQQMGLDWFDFWLKGVDNGIMDTPAVRAYVMGPGVGTGAPSGNFWRTSVSWPPPATGTAYYLHPGGVLSTESPTVASAETSYIADPIDPVPTLGGANVSDEYGIGPLDQRPADNRADVLVWQTERFLQPVEVSGPIKLVLYASSDQLDTDWVVKLEDVYSDSRPILVTDLVLQARHRVGLDREDLLTPGQIYEFEIELWDTSMTFGFLHSIRVAIASTNYPRFESNPQTGEPFKQHTGTVVATNRIYHDSAHPSRLILPIVDPAAVEGCAATEHVTGLTVHRLEGGTLRLVWNAVDDNCHRQYRIFAGTVGPQWPWIVRRPIAETTATEVEATDDGIFWQVISEGTDGGNGPYGLP